MQEGKALHSKLLTKLSSRFLIRNEFFAISEGVLKFHLESRLILES
jgi:hypothetical protein